MTATKVLPIIILISVTETLKNNKIIWSGPVLGLDLRLLALTHCSY